MTDLPSLQGTYEALLKYDQADAKLQGLSERDPSTLDDTDKETLEALFEELERLGEEVGRVYGQETKDRNNPEVCRQLIRPGPRVPAPGFQLSFVRRMVMLWKAGSGG